MEPYLCFLSTAFIVQAQFKRFSFLFQVNVVAFIDSFKIE